MNGQGSGWKGESRRHSLARKGIKTTQGKIKNGDKPLGKYEIDPKYLPSLEDFWINQFPKWDEEGIDIIGWHYELWTPHDASVGIFGGSISPTFDTLEDLKIWWHINGEKAIDIWYSDLKGQELWDALENVDKYSITVKQWKEMADLHEQGKRYAETGDPRVFKKDSRLEVLKSSGKVETIYEDQLAERENFKVGKFNWVVDGNSVIVTKDTPDGLFENIAFYKYKNFTQASDNAYRMAVKQANSGRD